MLDCGILQKIDAIAEGRLPEELDELTALGRALFRVNALTAQTLAVVVAGGCAAFGGNIAGWSEWCVKELGIDNASYRSHLLAVGKMLRVLRNSDCSIPQFRKVFGLAHDKQLALSRLPADRLPAFLSHYPELDRMSREEVRAAVSAALGETAPAAVQQLLPGFDKALDAIVSIDEGKLLEVAASPRFDTQTALKMSYSGVTLCKASVGYLADHADELDDDMLAELAENVEMIRNRLASAVADRRKKLLNN